MTRKVPNGSDISKKADGYGDNQDFDDDVSPSRGLFSYRELVAELRNKLAFEGYEMVHNPIGDFAGFDIYYQAIPEIAGLKVSDGFYYMKKLTKEMTPAKAKFDSMVKKFCNEQQSIAYEEDEKALAKAWGSVYSCLSDQTTNPKSAVAMTASNFTELDARKVTLKGKRGLHKVVPQLSWFPQNVQDYDPLDLLTIFPEAERQMLAILLGRAMVGAKDTQTAEGKLVHTARSYGILVGGAGLGKSSLLTFVTKAMRELGYTISTINGNFGKFGWGSIASADFAFIDDLNKDTQKELMSNSNTKSIVSNDYMTVEEKGQPAYTLKSTTVVLGCSNWSDPHFFLGLDPGSLSRVNQLQCLSPEETQARKPEAVNARLWEYWITTAERLNCDPMLLTARLLQECADLFLKTIGYSFDADDMLVKGEDTLEVVTKQLRSEFRIRIGLDHAEELPAVATKLVALAIADSDSEKEVKKLLDNLKHLEFDYRLLKSVVEMFLEEQKLGKDWLEFTPRHISYSCRGSLGKKWKELKNLDTDDSAEGAFTKLIKEIVSKEDNFGYPLKPSFYQTYWKPEMYRLEFQLEAVKDIRQAWLDANNQTELPIQLGAILEDVRATIKSLC